MIEVLALAPNEIVAGDAAEVLLTWQVLGDADQIQISAPDFEVTTAAREEVSISVQHNEQGVLRDDGALQGRGQGQQIGRA